jgi:sodium/potassium-transporting ATPase subunit alpha
MPGPRPAPRPESDGSPSTGGCLNRIHRLSVSEALASVRSAERGLSSPEAASRLNEFGPNRLEKVAQKTFALRLLNEFFRFFSVILWVAAGLAFLGNWFARGQGMAHVGVAIIVVILVSGTFSILQEYRVDRALAALENLLPRDVQALRDGTPVKLPVEGLVPGDVIVLEPGSVVPADCRLMEASGLRINDAPLTGESIPRARDTAPSSDEDLRRSKNIVLAGTSVLSGRGKGVVFATGPHTEFGTVARLTQASEKAISPLRRRTARRSITRTGAESSRWSSAMAGPSPRTPSKIRCSSWLPAVIGASPTIAGATADRVSPGAATTWTPTPTISRRSSRRST